MFVNVVGGVRVDEPGVDLAIALAVAGARRGVPIVDGAGSGSGSGRGVSEVRGVGGDMSVAGGAGKAGSAPLACFGELGLTGELRWVGHPERRLQEAERYGLRDVLAPTGSGAGAREVGTLREALAAALPRERRVPERPARARRLALAWGDRPEEELNLGSMP